MTIRNDLAAIVNGLEKIEEVLKEYATGISAQQERNRENPQSVRAEITFDKTSKSETQTDANRQHGTQEKIARYAFYAFLAATFYAGISALQLYEMRVQTSQVFHQSEVENADASVKAVQWLAQLRIAQQQASAAQDGVTAIQRQMRQDQRAWMNITFGTWHIVENEPLGAPWTLINTGKTPAKYVDGHAIVEKIIRGQIPHFSYDKYPSAHFGASLMVPGAPQNSFGFQSLQFKVNSKDTEPLNMSATDVTQINNGDAYVAVHGIIEYVDIFKTHHWIKFCSYTGLLVKIQDIVPPCTNYNDADDN